MVIQGNVCEGFSADICQYLKDSKKNVIFMGFSVCEMDLKIYFFLDLGKTNENSVRLSYDDYFLLIFI